MWKKILLMWKKIPRSLEKPNRNRFSGLEELGRVANAALRAQMRSELMLLPADDPSLKDASDRAWALVKSNDIEKLSHAISNIDYVSSLLEMWSENDAIADKFDGLLNVRVMLVAKKAAQYIERV